jgi:DNA (cytosine-5)-methyltransferase 1
MTLRHASFFSGAGGLDIGFERAGIRTVSHSEIDPYASAVLKRHWPETPNLGDITAISWEDIPHAEIWSGGFPCQDLSVAGKRAGFGGSRSSLAFTFLDLVERGRPRWLVLENVTGLFTSNNGADFRRLIGEIAQLGYGVAWRTVDARHFGVAQRRRRVFIVCNRDDAFNGVGAQRAAEVLVECEGGCGHIAAGGSPREDASRIVAARVGNSGGDISATVTAKWSKGSGGPAGDETQNLAVGSSVDTDGNGTVDGVARRVDNRGILGKTNDGDFQTEETVKAFQTRVDEKHGNFTMTETDVANSISALWAADTSHRSMTLVNTFGAETHRALQARDWKAGVANQDIGQEGFLVGEPVLSFPSRFGSNANVTEDQAQSFAHNAGAPAVLVGSSYDGLNQKLDGDGAHRTLRIGRDSSDFVVAEPEITDGDPMLPVGLDGHRYRCCGNGVVAPVAEWIGRRIVAVDAKYMDEGGANG